MPTEFVSARAPKSLVDAVNAHAETMGVTRSSVIIGALAEYVGFDLEGDLKEGEERRGEVFQRLDFLDAGVKNMILEKGELLERIEKLENIVEKLEKKKASEIPIEPIKKKREREDISPEIHYNPEEETYGPTHESRICKLTGLKTSTLRRKRAKTKLGESVTIKNEEGKEWELTLTRSEKAGTKTKVEWFAKKIS